MIESGQRIPEVTLQIKTEDGVKDVRTGELLRGKRVVVFAVPGAYTPTCTAKHLPGFVEKAAELRAKGIDRIVCTAVNDAFVMDAWGEAHGARGKIDMVADGSAKLAKALGLELDLTEKGMGVRSKRYAMIVEDGVVKSIHVDEAKLDKSSADSILGQL